MPIRSVRHSHAGQLLRWDLLELCRVAGFADACALCYYSALNGYLGNGMQMMFVAGK